MGKKKGFYVSIYAKIYTENFSDEMVNRSDATGDDVFEFLLWDAGVCYDDDDVLIPGDLNIWYLGCNEKWGEIQLNDRLWKWSWGESSFDTVEEFVRALYEERIISTEQFEILLAKIQEGRLIGSMYEIRDYLMAKRDGKEWNRPGTSNEAQEKEAHV